MKEKDNAKKINEVKEFAKSNYTQFFTASITAAIRTIISYLILASVIQIGALSGLGLFAGALSGLGLILTLTTIIPLSCYLTDRFLVCMILAAVNSIPEKQLKQVESEFPGAISSISNNPIFETISYLQKPLSIMLVIALISATTIACGAPGISMSTFFTWNAANITQIAFFSYNTLTNICLAHILSTDESILESAATVAIKYVDSAELAQKNLEKKDSTPPTQESTKENISHTATQNGYQAEEPAKDTDKTPTPSKADELIANNSHEARAEISTGSNVQHRPTSV